MKLGVLVLFHASIDPTRPINRLVYSLIVYYYCKSYCVGGYSGFNFESSATRDQVLGMSQIDGSIDGSATTKVDANEIRQKVAYLGPEGTFTYRAAVQEFGDSVHYVPVTNLSDIVASVFSDSTDFGVLPFENSTNGHVTTSLDLLRSAPLGKLQIVEEVYLDVHQCLLSSTSLKNIKRIYSHPQAFGQCETFLIQHLPDVERVNVDSTGKAAQLASEDRDSAAIASISSAEAANISVLETNIEDNKNNTTRFFVLSKSLTPYDDTKLYKTLIKFTVSHSRPGSLASTLQRFAEASINLTSISSRPNVSEEVLSQGQKWVYVFFLEFEGHPDERRVRPMLQRISKAETADEMHILGTFVDARRTSKVARLRGGAPLGADDQVAEELDHQSSDDASDTELETERPIQVIEGERFSADEDILDDYPRDTDDISCLHSKIRSIAALRLEKFPQVKTICLRQNEITKIESIPATLTELDLYDNQIGRIENLDNANSLVSLDLSFNRIKHIKRIGHLKHLQNLYLVQNKITQIENLEGLDKLKMLELGANRIRELKSLDCLPLLEELWLGKNKITELKNLDRLPKLRILSIQSNRITRISNLEALANTLEELYISHNGITELSGLASLRKLRVLDISNNRIRKLEYIAHLHDLEEFWASNNQLESFDEIEKECKSLTKLDTVYFEGNPLQRNNPTTYRNKVKLALHPGLKQIDANMLRA